MPKKRHQTRYSKPQSTAPASLNPSTSTTSTLRAAADPPPSQRGVNELLASLRRSTQSPGAGRAAPLLSPPSSATLPSVPPSIRQILQLPETPAPVPRRPSRFVDSSGRRLPPGPPPPRSGFIQSRIIAARAEKRAGSAGHSDELWLRDAAAGLPGAYAPARGSLVDVCLRQIALDWDFQRSYNRYYLAGLPSRLRSALIRRIGVWSPRGVDAAGLRTILLPRLDDEVDEESGFAGILPFLNQDFHYLDLSGSIGQSISIKELVDVLFPPAAQHRAADDVQDSWDSSDSDIAVPPALLPNITHLSLALSPESPPAVSWKHLLALAARLPTLTHLSLAYWPEPTFTPNAKFSSVVSPQGRTVQYGGTGAYSHSLDDDWAEAITVLRKLSRSLYGLEHLDLTGCGPWIEALWRSADGVAVDWTTHWGKVSTLVLRAGHPVVAAAADAAWDRPADTAITALLVEKHIVAQRAGKGRFITVDRDA